jgi:hypothetical protein
MVMKCLVEGEWTFSMPNAKAALSVAAARLRLGVFARVNNMPTIFLASNKGYLKSTNMQMMSRLINNILCSSLRILDITATRPSPDSI